MVVQFLASRAALLEARPERSIIRSASRSSAWLIRSNSLWRMSSPWLYASGATMIPSSGLSSSDSPAGVGASGPGAAARPVGAAFAGIRVGAGSCSGVAGVSCVRSLTENVVRRARQNCSKTRS